MAEATRTSLFTIPEAAEITGLSPYYLRRRVCDGVIPATRKTSKRSSSIILKGEDLFHSLLENKLEAALRLLPHLHMGEVPPRFFLAYVLSDI